MGRRLSDEEVSSLGLEDGPPPIDTSTPVREPGGAIAPMQAPKRQGRRLSAAEVHALGLEEDAQPARDTPSAADAVGRGVMRGASFGFNDELSAIAPAVAQFFTDGETDSSGKPLSVGDTYRKYRDETRGEDQAAEAAHPTATTIGELGGGLLTSALPVGEAAAGLSKAAKAARALKTSVALGAAGGLGSSNADLTKGDVGGAVADTAAGAGMGALAHGVVSTAAPLIGKIARPVASTLEGIAERRAAKASGMMLSDYRAAGNMGVVQERGRALLDRGLVGFGDKVENIAAKLRPAASESGQHVGMMEKAIDDAAMRSGIPGLDPKLLAQQIESEVVAPLSQSPFNKAIAVRIQSHADEIAKMPGPMGVKQLADLKRSLDPYLKWDSGEVGPAQDALRQLRGVIRDAADTVAEGVDPDLADAYKAARKLHHNLRPAEEIATDQARRQQANRTFSLSDQLAGLKGAMGGVAGAGLGAGVGGAIGGPAGAVVGGMVGKGVSRALRTRGAASMAVGADVAAKGLRGLPGVIAKSAPATAFAAAHYDGLKKLFDRLPSAGPAAAPVLHALQTHGPQGAAAMHYVQMQSNPSYQASVKPLLERGDDEPQ